MRAFSAILGLLFCLIATRANELPVIKDSEAIHNIGKNVEVRGFVVSVRTSPLGTTLINIGSSKLSCACEGWLVTKGGLANIPRSGLVQPLLRWPKFGAL